VLLKVSNDDHVQTLGSTCLLCIIVPGSISYYQFSNPEEREKYIKNLNDIVSYGIQNVEVLTW
jgi:hypothetical protein